MVTLPNALAAWGSDAFSATLKAELEQLRSDVLPIAHVVEAGNELVDKDLGIIVNRVEDKGEQIEVAVGVFFQQVIACCTCSGGNGMCDEAYCELSVRIDKRSGEAQFTPL